MAFLSGVKSLENVPRDAQGIAFPNVGVDREMRIPASGACGGCVKFEDHGKPCRWAGAKMLFGDERRDLVPTANRIDGEYLRDLQSYLWKMGYVANGYPGLEFIYNLGLGTANNVVQHTTYEILSVDASNGRRLRLRGPDPRAVGYAVSVPNPDWLPLPPDQQTEPRLLSLPGSNRLPVGSSVLFEFPSCLYGRLNPWLEKIEEPTGPVGGEQTFWVWLSHSASVCREPWDAAFPPPDGVYRLRIYSYLVSPEGWFDFQPSSPEAQWGLRKDVEYVPGDVVDGDIELLDGGGGSCRVLMLGDSVRVMLEFEDGRKELVPDGKGRVRTVDVGVNSWRTYLNLEGVELEGVETILVTYWPEAVGGEEVIVNGRGRCAWSKQVIDGYGGEDGFICENTICEKYRAGNYGGGTCWDTEADGFTLEAKETDAEKALMGQFWSAEPLVLAQGFTPAQAGSAASSHWNFAFERAGGRVPSLLSVCGGFFHRPLVAVSKTKVESWFGERMGVKRVYEDGNGRKRLGLQHGFFEGEFGLSPPVSHIPGWYTRDNARGVQASGVDAIFPTHHGPSCSVIDFVTGPDPTAFIRLARRDEGEVRHVTAISKTFVDVELSERVRRELP